MKRFPQFARWLLVALGLSGIVLLAHPPTALAAGVVGNGTPASCTETALNNKLSGGGTVTFNCGANAKTITLTFTKQISIDTTIDGGGKITLSASNTNHFQVYSGHILNIKNIKLTNGSSSSGGSIENIGTTNATNVSFLNNSAGTSEGGAVRNNGIFKAKNSTFQGNHAALGGAIYNDGGTVTVIGSTFTGNQANAGAVSGGAIHNDGGKVTIKTSTFYNNSAGEGGAVYTDYGTTNVIKKSTFDTNHATDSGGGIYNFGTITITASVIKNNTAGNTGGGIAHGGTLTMQTTTVSGNHAGFGAGMRDFGNSTTILTSTFSGNISTGDGGAIFSSVNTKIVNSTLSGNQAGASKGAGGLFQYGGNSLLQYVTIANNQAGYSGGVYSENSKGGSITMLNVLLSKNQNGNCGGATLYSSGGNLSSDTYCSVFTQSHDKQNKNAKLGALANNGGPTQTHTLLAGSPAINNALAIVGITKDQRNVARPKGTAPDTGAVEAQ